MIANSERAHIVGVDEARRHVSTRVGGEPTSPDGGESPPLGEYLGVVLKHRWLVATVTAVALTLASAYLVTAVPTYRSDTLLQVEEKAKGIAGLEDLSMLTDKAPADTEIEIIRSRSLLGGVVDELNLTVQAGPRTFPLFGGALFRRYSGAEPASAPLFGMSSYAWGGDQIQVTRFEVPEAFLDQPFRVVASGPGMFQLLGVQGETVGSGVVGHLLSVGVGEETLHLFVSELRAPTGTQFRVTRRRRAAVVDELQSELRISEKGKKTGILTMSLDGQDPHQISAVLDAVARRYVRQNVERKSAEAAKTLEFLQEQLPVLKKNVDGAEAALKAYQLRKGSVDLDAETQSMLQRAVDIEKSISELQMNRTELRQRFTDSHPALVALNEKEQQLRSERGRLESKMRGLPEQELESVRLTRDAKVAAELYFTLLNKSQELNVVKSGAIGNVRVLDPALKPYQPISPKKGPVLALSLVLGLALGIGLAFVRKSMDQGVEDPAEVEAVSGLSVYASVPHSPAEVELARQRARAFQSGSLLAAKEPTDLAIESLRSLRTALQFALVEARNNVLTISGASPGIGKSFLSANLAHVLATTGQRVLLIDCDLRRGQLHRYLGGKRKGGLSEALAGQLPLAEVTRQTGHEQLQFVATGTLPPNPSELVASARFESFLADASARYDLVLIDTPPILAVTDAAVIGRLSGVNLLALRSGRHPAREIAAAVKHFSNAGVTLHGAILNDVSLTAGRYSSYAYHYQYEYRSDAKDD